MTAFGKCGGGGRRRASREELPLAAVIGTTKENKVAVLVGLSATGARLRASNLPRAGDAMTLKIDCVRAFGVVAWSEYGECGVEFDTPIFPFEVERLRREARSATLTSGNIEQRLALADWETGLAR